jgi:hypothetical protein
LTNKIIKYIIEIIPGVPREFKPVENGVH